VHAARVAYSLAGLKVFSVTADMKTGVIAGLLARQSTRRRCNLSVPIWNESFSVKVKSCDEAHRKLLSLIQRLHDSIVMDQGPAYTQVILAELADYTDTHFASEEALLVQTKYSGLELQCHQHQTFVAKLVEFRQSLEYAPTTTPLAMVEYLKNWLVRHIKMVDCQYSSHLNANGIQ
jgi:hemerythrin-like metal-binding protein